MKESLVYSHSYSFIIWLIIPQSEKQRRIVNFAFESPTAALHIAQPSSASQCQYKAWRKEEGTVKSYVATCKLNWSMVISECIADSSVRFVLVSLDKFA